MTLQYSLIAFDLDDTLAPSKSLIEPRMARALEKLLDISQVCVISGGQLEQFHAQLLDGLEASEKELEKLHLMPTCGTRYLTYKNGQWHTEYSHQLPAELRNKATRIIREEAEKLGYWEHNPWGQIIEDRGSQITFSALGQEAPLEAKREWDPTGEKKNTLREAVAHRLPELEVRTGGSTSIDITERGVDKAYGIQQLVKATGIPTEEMFYVGDRLDPQGNDYPVLKLGLKTLHVTGWKDTAEFVENYISTYDGTSH